MKVVYAALCVLGTVVPYSQLVPFVIDNGLNIPLLIEQLFANRISTFFGLDVIISALVLIVLSTSERTRFWYLPILGTLTVGVSLGLPLYLYLRERDRESQNNAPEMK